VAAVSRKRQSSRGTTLPTCVNHPAKATVPMRADSLPALLTGALRTSSRAATLHNPHMIPTFSPSLAQWAFTDRIPCQIAVSDRPFDRFSWANSSLTATSPKAVARWRYRRMQALLCLQKIVPSDYQPQLQGQELSPTQHWLVHRAFKFRSGDSLRLMPSDARSPTTILTRDSYSRPGTNTMNLGDFRLVETMPYAPVMTS
jgi:hypothetical protein